MKSNVNFQEHTSKERTVPVELNLATPSIWYPQEKRKIFEIRSFKHEWSDEDGKGISAEIKIKYDPELGTLNTADYRVLLCLMELWVEQNKPDKIIFSVRHIIRMLGSQMGRDTYHQVRISLLRLAGVGFNWNGAFYDFLEKKYIHIEKAFSVISDLGIVTKKDKNVTTEESYAVLNEIIIKNLFSYGSLPTKRSIIQSFNSPIAQSLYVHLDRKLYGTNQYSRTTKGLIQDLGLTAKRYNYLSNRKEIFFECREQILNKETSFGEIVDYFELEKGKGKDWVVFVRRTGTSKIIRIIDLGVNQNSLTVEQKKNTLKTNLKAPDSTQTPQPIVCHRQGQKASQKANLQPSSQSLKTTPSKAKKKAVGKKNLSQSIQSFLNTFCKLFPNANVGNIQKSKVITNAVSGFVKQYKEQANDFLYFAENLSKQSQYSRLAEAQTPNYLFSFTIGNQLIIDAWLANDSRKAILKQEEIERIKAQQYQIYLKFKEDNTAEYREYVKILMETISKEEREKFLRYKKSSGLQLENDDFILSSFVSFSQKNLEVKAPYFPEWAAMFKPEEYEQVKYCRDTSKESRAIAQSGW